MKNSDLLGEGPIIANGLPEIRDVLSRLELLEVARAVEDSWAILSNYMAENKVKDLSFECYRSSEVVRDTGRKLGLDCAIVEGWIKVGPDDWLEHRANIFRLATHIVFADLASGQFAGREDGFLIVASRSQGGLTVHLREHYAWH